MKPETPRLMTPFDDLVTPPGLYALKLMLPYLPPRFQHHLAVYIKFTEFTRTIRYFRGFPSSSGCSPSSGADIFHELKRYMSQEEQDTFEQMESMMNMMEMMQQADTADFMQDIMKGAFCDERMDQPPDDERYGSGEAGTDQKCRQPDPRQEREGACARDDGADYRCQ